MRLKTSSKLIKNLLMITKNLDCLSKYKKLLIEKKFLSSMHF